MLDREQLYIKSIRVDDSKPADKRRYPFDIPAVAGLMNGGELKLKRPVTILVGENGSGKSTLIEAIAVAFGLNPEGGTRNFNFTTFRSDSDLSEYLVYERINYPRDSFFLRAESFYNVASEIERLNREGGGRPLIDSYGGESLHKQSHGESFFSLMRHRFGGHGLYILDEPEAALSPARLLAMLVIMKQLLELDSQFIIATHSPILMGYPGATLIELSENGFREARYEDTEHYRITRRFLENRSGMLRELGLTE